MKDTWEYPMIHPEAMFTVLLAYAAFTKKRKDLKNRGVLDQLYAMMAGWA